MTAKSWSAHSSQFMGGMGVLHLIRLLFTLRHLNPLISPFLPLQLCLLCTPHLLTLLPLHKHLWHLLLTLSTQGDQDLNGSHSNGLSHNTIGRSESLLQPFPLHISMITVLMTPLTSFMHIQPLLLSPHLINNPTSTL